MYKESWAESSTQAILKLTEVATKKKKKKSKDKASTKGKKVVQA
jgi:hypothetical protein